MKRLLLMRHAKSSWDDETLADRDRPLNRRGERAARRMGRLIVKEDLSIDAVLCSTAERTRETWQRIATALAQAGRSQPRVSFEPELYLCSAHQFVDIIRHQPSIVNNLLVLAHNPGLENWLARLTGHAEAFPTGALAVVSCELTDWTALSYDTRGHLKHLWRPRDLVDDV